MVDMSRFRGLGGPASAFTKLLRGKALAGLVLMFAAAISLIIANSPAAGGNLCRRVERPALDQRCTDGGVLPARGPEIKREFVDGQLATWRRRVLLGTAAAGGMVAPELINITLNAAIPETLRGWAIPTAMGMHSRARP